MATLQLNSTHFFQPPLEKSLISTISSPCLSNLKATRTDAEVLAPYKSPYSLISTYDIKSTTNQGPMIGTAPAANSSARDSHFSDNESQPYDYINQTSHNLSGDPGKRDRAVSIGTVDTLESTSYLDGLVPLNEDVCLGDFDFDLNPADVSNTTVEQSCTVRSSSLGLAMENCDTVSGVRFDLVACQLMTKENDGATATGQLGSNRDGGSEQRISNQNHDDNVSAKSELAHHRIIIQDDDSDSPDDLDGGAYVDESDGSSSNTEDYPRNAKRLRRARTADSISQKPSSAQEFPKSLADTVDSPSRTADQLSGNEEDYDELDIGQPLKWVEEDGADTSEDENHRCDDQSYDVSECREALPPSKRRRNSLSSMSKRKLVTSTSSLDLSTRPTAARITTALQSEEIPIRGFLTLRTFKTDVVYCLTFSQDLLPVEEVQQRQDVFASSDWKDSKSYKAKKSLTEKQEQQLAKLVQGDKTWAEIGRHFPSHTLQSLKENFFMKQGGRPRKRGRKPGVRVGH